ncbi:hypothetical protein EWB00_008695, partial [Schistosoma japonicum]
MNYGSIRILNVDQNNNPDKYLPDITATTSQNSSHFMLVKRTIICKDHQIINMIIQKLGLKRDCLRRVITLINNQIVVHNMFCSRNNPQ